MVRKLQFHFSYFFSLHLGFKNLLEVDGMMKENMVAHNTRKYKIGTEALVFRRGMTFKSKIAKTDEFRTSDNAGVPFFFTLCSGAVAREADGSMITISCVTANEYGRLLVEKNAWGYQIVSEDDTSYTVEIYIPANASAGRYQMMIENEKGVLCYFQFYTYILFNPWCAGKFMFQK